MVTVIKTKITDKNECDFLVCNIPATNELLVDIIILVSREGQNEMDNSMVIFYPLTN